MHSNQSPRFHSRTSESWNRRRFLSTLGRGAAAASLAGAATFNPAVARAIEGTEFPELQRAISTGGVIASISPEATAVGIGILDAGGNAIDAAVATVFALGVTRPEMCGIGGCGMLLYRSRSGEAAALDFQGSAPISVDAETFAGDGMHKDPTVFFLQENSGHRVVGIPGVVAGMESALQRYGSGRFTLSDLIAPAEVLAREGFEISDELALFIFLEAQRLSYYKETAEIYLPWWTGYRWPELEPVIGSELPVPRQKLVQEKYANSLQLIRQGGAAAFYTGWIAEQIAEAMATAEERALTNPVLLANGPRWGGFSNDLGLIKYEELASYQAIWREALMVNYRNHEVFTMPPCGSGVLIGEMLNILEGFDLQSFGQSSADHLHVLAEAQKIAHLDRELFIADPDIHPEVAGNVAFLLSNEYAKQRRAEIDMSVAKMYEAAVPVAGYTNHASFIDAEGNAVAVTTTQNWPFGSVVVAGETGFVLNSQLGDWIGRSGLDQPRSGARPRTNMSPTIVVRKGRAKLVTGAAGGNRIPMGIVQQVINTVDFGLAVDQAIDAERMDAVNFALASRDRQAGFVDVLAIESGGNRPLHPDTKQQLTDRKHKVNELGEYGMDRPNVQSAGVNLVTGLRMAACDPRSVGGAGGQ